MTIFIDKKALCSTPLKDFCEIQGIGNDPMYMRPGSVQSIVGRYIPKDMQDFLAVPEYSAEDDAIVWFAPNWTDTPRRINDLYGEEKEKYDRIYRDTLNVYNDVKKAVILLERQFGITDYEVLENNKIKIFSHLNETGAINMQLSKGGVVVEKIDIKGEKLEEYLGFTRLS